jgi:alpha-glucosidase
MPQIRYHRWHLDENALYLAGDFFATKIQLYQNNVWRLFSWHRPQDEHKKSWVFNLDLPIPFKVDKQKKFLRLSDPDTNDILITLDPFCWTWSPLKCTGMNTLTSFDTNRNETFAEALPADFNSADLEVNNGDTIGAGISLTVEESAERNYYGLGERTGFLNKKERTWVNWASDQFGHAPDADPLYQAHPFVMGIEDGTAFGLYLDETWETRFDLADSQPDRSSICTKGPTFDLYLIAGPKPKDVIATFTKFCGRPDLPPLWAFGMHQSRWSYPDDKTVISIVSQYRKRQIPLDAIWLDIDYMDGYKNFTFHAARFPDPKKTIAKLKKKEIKTVVIVDAGVKMEAGYETYESGQAKDAFVKDHFDKQLVGEVWPKPVVWPDFIQKYARDWWADCHRFYTDLGVSGIWNDMNEPSAFNLEGKTLPPEAKHGRYRHAEVHNIYGHQMCRATYLGLKKLNPNKRPFVLTRSGFTGIQKYAFVWTGDNHSYWEQMETSIPMLLNLGLSGVPFCGADIGGFASNCSGEMLARWTWLGLFYPFMRNHSSKDSRRQEPWAFGRTIEKAVVAAIRLRYRLMPYIYTLAYEASMTGMPLMRPLFLEYPQDKETQAVYDQFLFGSDLLVAPILRPGQKQRMVYLPQGSWQDFWTAKVFGGANWMITKAPINQIPLLIRSGGAVPTTSWTKATGTAIWEKITWNIALADKIFGRLYEDEGDGYTPGKLQELNGTFSSGNLRLSIQNRPKKRETMLKLRGVLKPHQSDIPYSYKDNILILKMNRDKATIKWA